VEGYFFNDIVAFDLNTLQVAGNRWEMLIANAPTSPHLPAPRTNHSVVSWQDKLFLFGGTDGTRWFNDVWTYDPAINRWTELDCIGYIPAAREGHAAALINDVMYIFGGRIQDGTDLGDLVAFKISTRRWYMFQNMGMSPSPRSGHSMTAFGNHIIVLAGEPSSAPRDTAELSLAYVLDTNKIRYPSSEPNPQPLAQPGQPGAQVQATPMTQQITHTPAQLQAAPQNGLRTMSSDRGPGIGAPPGPIGPPKIGTVPGLSPQPPGSRSESPQQNGPKMMNPALRMGAGTPTQLQPQQSPAPTPAQTIMRDAAALRAKTPSRGGQNPPPENMSPANKESVNKQQDPQVNGTFSGPQSKNGSTNPSRTGSRMARQQPSIDSFDTPRQSVDTPATTYSRDVSENVDSGVGSSPAMSHPSEELIKELEAAKSRNAWYASELALARKAGYQPGSSGNPILDQQAAEIFGDDDRPLIEALLKMKSELTRVQGSIDSQAEAAAVRIAEIEKQRDSAISEAVYARTKLAAHGGTASQRGTPQPDALRGSISPDLDRANEMSRRLAGALSTQKELNAKIESIQSELESERRARTLAEETAEAAEKRISELDNYKQRSAGEVESLRAELHEIQKQARQEAAAAAEATSARQLLEAEHSDLKTKHSRIMESSRGHTNVLETLRDAVGASTEKADHLEMQLQQERELRLDTEQKFAQFKSDHEQKVSEVESLSRRLESAESLAEKHAAEARTHREAVLSGLGAVSSRSLDNETASDSRVEILTQQLEAANAIARQNQDAADLAAEKLRRAEERIAGLEAYQEQTSRENLTIRKQSQIAIRDMQSLQTEKQDAQQRLEASLLEATSFEVQLKTVKHLLEERGINPADVRRSRVLDSPGSRYGTPDLNRIRELETQLDDSVKAHEDMRHAYEQREQDVAREWEEKLQALSNDHQGTIKYVRGLEKIFNKMKAEVQRYKSSNAELEKELETHKTSRGIDEESSKQWQSEREQLRKDMLQMQDSVKSSMSTLESQLQSLKKSLSDTETERDHLQQSAREMQSGRENATAELITMKKENKVLEARALDAEHKVQMFLDQFETSVDNYRRMSRLEQQNTLPRGLTTSGKGTDADSLYSNTTTDEYDDDADDTETEGGAKKGGLEVLGATGKKNRDRTSIALDSLTAELESLRGKWETTRGTYKLNDQFDFEKTPGSANSVGSIGGMGGMGGMGGNSLATWARGLDTDTESIESQESAERLMVTPAKTGKTGVSAGSSK